MVIYNMDFLLSKYDLIFTEFDSTDRGGAEVNTFKFSIISDHIYWVKCP